MKKLLIAMTAAAVGTCAWADGEQTLLNETFESTWTLTDNTWWTYSAGEAADGELTLADGKLSLNTGSKVLTGSFTSDDKPKAIGTDGLYFNATVTFKDPSDTLPELKDSDKFALVVLDNVESIDAGYTTTPATNLWVIAKYGESGQRAYQLDVEVTPSWLTDEHKIVVKAYNNVMANGNCAGFLVKVDNEDNDTVCTVVQSCAIVENVIDYGTFCPGGNYFGDDGLGGSGNLGYLGYPKNAILGKRYGDSTLILSNVPSSDTLASVDFQGQGVIDDVSLATTGANFGAEAKTLMISATANGVTDIACDSNAYAETGYIIPANAETVTVTFKLASGYVLSAPAGAVKGDNGVYTYTYTVGEDNNQSLTIGAFLPAAMVNGVEVSATDFASILTALRNQGTSTYEITLNDNVVTPIEIGKGQTLVLDLNGKTVADIYNEGTLTIDDSSVAENGTVLANQTEGCSVFNDGGVLTILGGCFEGAIDNEEGTVSISGGKFKDTNGLEDALDDGLTFSEKDDNDYYSVVTETVTPLPDLTLPENATAEQEKTAVEAALGTQADAAVKANITNKTEYAAFKTWAGTNGGAATVVASVNAWVAYALDNAGLLDDAKVTLTDNDITVESFGQAENAAAGQFTLEISLKDVAIGNATTANLLKIFEAVGTTDLKVDFTAGAVTTDVVAADGKAKFTVAPSAATKPNAFFFKAQIKK